MIANIVSSKYHKDIRTKQFLLLTFFQIPSLKVFTDELDEIRMTSASGRSEFPRIISSVRRISRRVAIGNLRVYFLDFHGLRGWRSV